MRGKNIRIPLWCTAGSFLAVNYVSRCPADWNYSRLAVKCTLLVFFVSVGLVSVYGFLKSRNGASTQDQILSCAWMLGSAVSLAFIKFHIVL